MPFIKKSLLLLFLTIVLAGCSLTGNTPEEEVHIVLESTVKLEKFYSESEETLGDIEAQEQVIYNKILEMNSDDMNAVEELSKEAITLAKEREAKIKSEKQSINSAKKEFSKIDTLLDGIDENEIKETIVDIKEIMVERYKVYDVIYDTYLEAIKNDIKLYELLQSKEVTSEKYQEQLEINNESYAKIFELNTTFNELTHDFNDSRKNFVKAAGLKVKEK